MKLHLTPEQIAKLNSTILKTMAKCEKTSIENGGEAEVYYVDNIKRKNRYAHYYVIVEKVNSSECNYCAGLWIDDSSQHACICTANNLDEMGQKLPKEIERLKEINREIKRDIADRNPNALHNLKTTKERF